MIFFFCWNRGVEIGRDLQGVIRMTVDLDSMV